MLEFRKAVAQDAEQIATLTNSAYRGATSRQGWTTEADLLDGLRTTSQEIQQLVASEDSFFLVGLRDNQLLASIHVERHGDEAHIGMFVVRPEIQGGGCGKQLLAAAEQAALSIWSLRVFVMHVITLRQELISFYERRGYRRTGRLREFPANSALWQPKISGLQLEVLEKNVQP